MKSKFNGLNYFRFIILYFIDSALLILFYHISILSIYELPNDFYCNVPIQLLDCTLRNVNLVNRNEEDSNSISSDGKSDASTNEYHKIVFEKMKNCLLDFNCNKFYAKFYKVFYIYT